MRSLEVWGMPLRPSILVWKRTSYSILCYAMLCYAMLCYAMLCYAMLFYAMLCCAMLCYSVLYSILVYLFSLPGAVQCSARHVCGDRLLRRQAKPSEAMRHAACEFCLKNSITSFLSKTGFHGHYG